LRWSTFSGNYNEEEVSNPAGAIMAHEMVATFEGGVFKPDRQPALAENTRVRLLVEVLRDEAEEPRQQAAWTSLQQLWQQSTFNSHGDRLTRDQLHERR
jgi:predicted DNA-binding antitoxin AbrB/MazE fold protein